MSLSFFGNGTVSGPTLNVDGNLLIGKLHLEKSVSSTISSGNVTLNLSEAQVFLIDLNSNITTVSITNVPVTSNIAINFSIVFTADGTQRTVSWPASVRWAGGSAPTLSSTSGKKDLLHFISYDNGTTWLAFIGGLFF